MLLLLLQVEIELKMTSIGNYFSITIIFMHTHTLIMVIIMTNKSLKVVVEILKGDRSENVVLKILMQNDGKLSYKSFKICSLRIG